MVKLPQHLLSELDGFVKQENVNRSEFIYQATKMYHETGLYGNGQNKFDDCI
jgi:metal-responsive CopG/Arc/MetJ family transcriptional regulator